MLSETPSGYNLGLYAYYDIIGILREEKKDGGERGDGGRASIYLHDGRWKCMNNCLTLHTNRHIVYSTISYHVYGGTNTNTLLYCSSLWYILNNIIFTTFLHQQFPTFIWQIISWYFSYYNWSWLLNVSGGGGQSQHPAFIFTCFRGRGGAIYLPLRNFKSKTSSCSGLRTSETFSLNWVKRNMKGN